MTPLDWRGPEFLVFFAIASVVVVGGAYGLARLRIRWRARTGAGLVDPMMIAFLRGGTKEVTRVAILSMFDRGMLTLLPDGEIQAAVAAPAGRSPVERAILAVVARPLQPLRPDSLTIRREVAKVCASYERRLRDEGYLAPSGGLPAELWPLFAAGLLAVFAAVKIVVALSRGRTNVGFLVILVVIVLVAAARLWKSLRLAGIRAAIGDFRVLFADLRARAARLVPGRSNRDLEFLASVFGAAAVPAAVYPWSQELFESDAYATRSKQRQRTHERWSPDDGLHYVPWCGSSASSCGASAGSSCGGGGCGGGGCGGCGS